MTTPEHSRLDEPPRWAAWLVVAAAIAGAAIFASWWNGSTRPVFAARAHPVLHRALLYDNPAAPYELSSMVPDNHPPVLALANWFMGWFGRSYASIMGAQTVWLALWIAANAIICAKLGGRGAMATGALFAATLPMAYVCALGFDDHMFNLALTTCAVAALAFSNGLTRVSTTLLAGLFAGFSIRYAFIASNGILTAATVLCAAGGLAVSELASRRRHIQAASRGGTARLFRELRPMSIGAAALLAGLIAGLWRPYLRSQIAVAYYAGEVGNSPVGGVLDWLIAMPVYLYISARHLLGPTLFVATVVGVGRLARSSAQGRWMLVAWLVIPVVALSLSPKKNPYYIYGALAAAPVIVAIALSTIESRVRRRALTAFAVAGCALWTFLHATLGGEAEMPKIFEAYTFEQGGYVLRRPVTKPSPDEAEAKGLLDVARPRHGDSRDLLFVVPGPVGPMEELRYFLQERDAGARVFAIAVAESVPPVDVDPLLLVPRVTWDAVGERGVTGIIEDSIAYILQKIEKTHDAMGQIETAGDPVARAEFLRTLAREPWTVIRESDRYVLLDRGGP